jgi:hypothetical protein
VNEEALAHWGLSRQKQTNKQIKNLTIFTPKQLLLNSLMKDEERRTNVACMGGKGNASWNLVGESETKSRLEDSGVE